MELENRSKSIAAPVVSVEIVRRRVTGTAGLYICRCIPSPAAASEPALKCRSQINGNGGG